MYYVLLLAVIYVASSIQLLIIYICNDINIHFTTLSIYLRHMQPQWLVAHGNDE